MTQKVLIGYFIRRTAKNPAAFRGKTTCAWPHLLFDTREKAQEYLVLNERAEQVTGFGSYLDPRFDYDIAEAYMLIGHDEEHL